MDSIIKKYNPSTKEKLESLNKSGIFRKDVDGMSIGQEVGLEKMAKDLITLSNGRLTELKEMRAP
jgi:hypothetical protein